MEHMNEINTTTSLQGNEVPPADMTNGSSGFDTSASETSPSDSGTSPSPPSASPPSASVNPRVKVLERKNGMIAGVAGGIADYFDIDPTVIRLVLAGLALLTMPALPLAYIVAWIIIPEEGKA